MGDINIHIRYKKKIVKGRDKPIRFYSILVGEAGENFIIMLKRVEKYTYSFSMFT